MTLIKTSVLTAISTSIKILTGLINNKVIAIFIGPAGLASIGNFQNFATVLMGFSNGAINNGIIKYSAEYFDEHTEKNKILSTGIVITVCCSIFISLFLILFHRYLSVKLLHTEEYSDIFLIFGFTISLFALNSFFLSVLNGHKEIKKYVTVNIISSIVGLFLTSGLVYFKGLYGALLSYTIIQSVVFFVTLIFVIKSPWFKIEHFIQGYDKQSLIKLGKYSAMTIVSTVTLPVSLMVIRNYIGTTLSWNDAGCWEGVWRISSMYLMVVTTSLSVYYLPRLSEIKNKNELRKEIFDGYKIILPIVAFMALGIYVLKDFIILILFTRAFNAMRGLFAFQMLGDFMKIASWLLSYLMIAKGMTRTFIYTEVIFSASFVFLSLILISLTGLKGVTYAYALNYLFYFITMILIFRDLLNEKK